MSTISKTIGTAVGRDYSTITAWEAALGAAAGGAGNVGEGVCYNDSTFTDGLVSISATVDGVILTVAESDRHDGTSGTGARWVQSGRAGTFTPNMASVSIKWLEIDGNDMAHNSSIAYLNVQYVNFTLQNTLMHDFYWQNYYGPKFIIIGSTTDGATITNNIIYGVYAPAIPASCYVISIGQGAGNSAYIYNNTIHNMLVVADSAYYSTASGISAANVATSHIKNNIVTDISSPKSPLCFSWSGTNIDTDTNLSSDATADDAGGTGQLINKTAANQYISTVVGSEDLHLKTGSDAIDVGTDIGTTPADVNIDINGRDRDAKGDTWDIGAHEFVPPEQNYMIHQNERIEVYSKNTLVWSFES